LGLRGVEIGRAIIGRDTVSKVKNSHEIIDKDLLHEGQPRLKGAAVQTTD
jgi:hypothetical protein